MVNDGDKTKAGWGAGAQLGGRERGLDPPGQNGGHTIIPDSMSFFGGGR